MADFNSNTVGGLLVSEAFRWVTQHVGPTAWMVSVDHVFVRGLDAVAAEAGVVNDDALPSDHRPVWALIGTQHH